MSKFNILKRKNRETINHMGAKAYKYDEKYELVSTLLTTFVEDSYYRSSNDTVKRLVELMSKTKDIEFMAKAIIYARTIFHMRSVSHVMGAEISAYLSGKTYAKNFYENLVVRPDDMLETVAVYFNKGGKTLPNAMKKGFANAFDKFDGYQLAKYRGENKMVKLIDLVNLVHPTPTQKNEKALTELVAGTLRNKDTWESKLTSAGQNAKGATAKAEAKKASWEELILAKRLGYMATLRNLRNILESNVSVAAFESVLTYLSNDKAVQNSKQFPFRFLSAYAEIEKLKITGNSNKLVFEKDGKTDSKRVERVLEAIEKAINVSVKNLPLLEGETVILSDNSGSMGGDAGGSSAVSAMSKVNTAAIANLFAALYWSRCDNTLVGLFGDRLVMPTMDRTKGLFANYKTVSKAGKTCGPGTEAGIFHMFERLIKEKRKVARIVIFSDMQIGTGCSWYDTKGRRGDDFNKLYESYRKNINPDVKVYSVNLKGYGTTVFKGNVFKIAGWSEKIFNIMEMLEQDPNALISEINRIEL